MRARTVRMLEVFEAIGSRRSVRKYTKKSISDDLVFEILDAGRWAPSASNRQACRFIVLRGEEIKRRVAEVTTYGKFLDNAALGIAVIADPQVSFRSGGIEDGAVATQNMLLAAQALGLGSCWIGSYNAVYEERVKELLDIPTEKRLLSIISIGYSDEYPTKKRKELKEIVFTGKYGRN